MTATQTQFTTTVRIMYVAFELGWNKWKLAFATAAADNPRLRTVKARDTSAVLAEFAKAKIRFGLPADAPVICCYEAGRDGHWLHRFLNAQPGTTCHEVDSSSIEVNRRQRRAKTDTLDAGKSLAGLTPTPYASGESAREQGISKAGNRRLRVMALEIAWCWVQFQPGSELARWFQRRFGVGKRQRKVGIVAVARKLLVALWKFLEHGQEPAGAVRVDWQSKVRVPREMAAAVG
jgi:transposase